MGTAQYQQAPVAHLQLISHKAPRPRVGTYSLELIIPSLADDVPVGNYEFDICPRNEFDLGRREVLELVFDYQKPVLIIC